MLRRFPCRWLPFSAVLLFVVPACAVSACAEQPAAPAADITFVLRDADHIATWPVARPFGQVLVSAIAGCSLDGERTSNKRPRPVAACQSLP